jgi:hypothetical protein
MVNAIRTAAAAAGMERDVVLVLAVRHQRETGYLPEPF